MAQYSSYQSLRTLLAPDLTRFNQRFRETLASSVPLAQQVADYYLSHTGKQLRPLLTLLAARMVGEVTENTLQGAIAIELLHNATLMHDDVVDQSPRRHGVPTVNQLWDNRIAILMGDFFLSQCLSASNATGTLAVSERLAACVKQLVEGELLQISLATSHRLSEEEYLHVVRGKTASLFRAAAEIGALTAGAAPQEVDALATIGEDMGVIFQIRDDIFDYYPSNDSIGKPTGHDILEGKVTLPLLYALQHASDAQSYIALLQADTLTPVEADRLVAFAIEEGGVAYAQDTMQHLAASLSARLQQLPDNVYRQALADLVAFFAQRAF